MAVEIMTANGKSITITKGDRHSQDTIVFFVLVMLLRRIKLR